VLISLGAVWGSRSGGGGGAVWTSVREPPGHTDGGTFTPCIQWTDLARLGGCGGSLGALGCSYPPPLRYLVGGAQGEAPTPHRYTRPLSAIALTPITPHAAAVLSR
jgi:hypothetical protein